MRAEEVGSNVSTSEATDRLAVQSHPAGNGGDGLPLSYQLVNLGMSLLVPRRKPTFSRHGLAATAIFPGAVSWLRRVGCVNSVLPANRLVVKTALFLD